MIWHREILEELGGFDESFDFGEDRDIKIRAAEAGYEIENSDASDGEEMPDSFTEVFRQGRWYGKSFLKFMRKHPSIWPSFLLTGFFVSVPFLALGSIFSIYARILMLLEVSFMMYLSFEYYRLSSSPEGLVVPLVKQVRSIGIFVGVIESFFIEDLGKSS